MTITDLFDVTPQEPAGGPIIYLDLEDGSQIRSELKARGHEVEE